METRACKNCKKDFAIQPDDFGFYEKMQVPPPSLCPNCRLVRRLAWKNDYNLYPRTCDLCGKRYISIYHPDTDFKTYCPKCFHGDGWDPYSYGREYDPTRSFIDQYFDLVKEIPHLGIVNDDGFGSINCLYTHDVAFSKNCAMAFVCWKLENVFNSSYLNGGANLCDCLCAIEKCEYVHDGLMIENNSNCRSVYWAASCLDCAFCYDGKGCTDCFMSVGLRNKQYYFKNEPCAKEEYEKRVSKYALNTRTGYKNAKEEFMAFLQTRPRKYADMRNCTNCSGTDLVRAKNTTHANFAPFSEDSKYVNNGIEFKQCYDCSGAGEAEVGYECMTPDQSHNSLVTIYSWKNTDVSYSIDCHSSLGLLGCISLKKGEYSILNKRYSKEEYHALKDTIVADMERRGEWGEFFPAERSFFGLNETRAIELLPLSKDEAQSRGYKWRDDFQQTRGKETVAQEDVPEAIENIPDSFVNEILACGNCERNYKILPEELRLYRYMKVPIPETCFFCRQSEREALRGGFELTHKKCDCVQTAHGHSGRCPNEFETFFTKETRPLYCEECYQSELI